MQQSKTSQSKTLSRPLDRKTELKVLKAGYTSIMMYIYPFIDSPEQTRSEDFAYFLCIEKKYSEIPEELWLSNLCHDISSENCQRISKLWTEVLKTQKEFHSKAKQLKRLWANAPEVSDCKSETIVNNLAAETSNQCKKVMMARITDEPGEETPISATAALMEKESQLAEWQSDEKSARQDYYREHKKYISSLRAYYELLLETQVDEETGEVTDAVLPIDHPQRQNIAIANRYLRVIAVAHQAIAAAKTGHHNQEGKLVRKIDLAPYLFHIFEVTMGTIRDVIPYVIEKEHLGNININALIILAAIHDLIEDTKFDIETLNEKLRTLMDDYDTGLISNIKGAYGFTARDIIREYLKLIKESDVELINSALRMLSNNTELDREERLKAANTNLFGRENTIKYAKLQEEEAKQWQIPESTSETFKKFPEEHDGGKLSKFLVRLTSIKGGAEAAQLALIIKNEDRAQNLGDLNGMPLEKQFETLRETASRLVAYQIYDHNFEKRPPYNSLRRLIITACSEYERLRETNPQEFTNKDQEYLEFLYESLNTIIEKGYDQKEPPSVTEPVKKYRTAFRERARQAAEKNLTPEEMPLPFPNLQT